jgi:host factor-I protein
MIMQKAVVKKSKGKKRTGAAARPAQYRFLTELAEERRPVAVFLVNGLKLEGRIVSFDDYAILLEGEMSDHVYKHAISTIQPLTGAAGKAGGVAKTRTQAGVTRMAAAADVDIRERKPRQPTIVVRPRRRLVKSDNDAS